jgi:hypothetical protein
MTRIKRVLVATWLLVAVFSGVLLSRADSLQPPPARPRATGARPEKAADAPVGGLHCSLVADKAEVPMGGELMFTLHLQFNAEEADPKVNLLNAAQENWRAEFALTNTATAKTYHRKPYDPGMPWGPTRPADILALRSHPARSEQLRVYLLSPRGEQVPAGVYRVTATYENTAKEQVEFVTQSDGSLDRRPYQGPWMFWKGKIASNSLTLKVTPIAAGEVVLTTHSALDVVRRKQPASDGRTIETIGYAWSRENPKGIRVTRRPGYVLGRSYSFHVSLNGKEVPGVGGSGLQGGAWEAGRSEHFLPPEIVQRVLAGERLQVAADVVVFETSTPAGHMWSPESGDYKVLWQGRVESVE